MGRGFPLDAFIVYFQFFSLFLFMLFSAIHMHTLCSVLLPFCWPSLVVGTLRPLFSAFYLWR